jgi:YD repeat-containing protein
LLGDGRERREASVRNSLGQIDEAHGADGSITTYERNLLGWTLFLHRWRAQAGAGAVDTTEFHYNNVGRVTRVIDPAQQVSEFDYDPFGAFEEHRLPGNPAITTTFRYDAVGRPLRTIRQSGTILTEYDGRGDPIRDWLETGAAPQLIAEREYDDLGRLWTTSYHNPALSWIQAADRVVTNILAYDKLDRLVHEEVRVGSAPSRAVDSVWDIVPPSETFK